MKKTLLVGIILGFIFGGCSGDGIGSGGGQAELEMAKLDGTPVTARFSGKNRKKNITFDHAKGNIVLAVYWSTSCPPCRAEIPHLIKLQEKYRDKLTILGILVEDKSKEEIKEFAEYYGMNYDILYGEPNYIMADAMGGVRGIPAMFLYDKQGKQAKHYVGLIPPEMLEAEIVKLF
ncbi:MAG: TlpA family protein disulfide reductase [Campylobacterales bacterium]|nr:TlpA family protein disulfide reductase [Campylobacterales bacterium]